MIGNDIVDLNLARQESNWRRNGFLAKVFTAHEQQLLQSASDPDVLVWLLWSMKESAYKVIVRETGQRFFAPQKLACFIENSISGVVEGKVFYQKLYSTTSIVTTRYVASVAFPADAGQPVRHEIVTFDHTDYQHQHDCIREKIKQHYVTRFAISESNVQLQKDRVGVPTLIAIDSSGNMVNKPVSLSHHGHYGAFVMIQTPG